MKASSTRLKKFWATMFGYSLEEMERPGFSITNSGHYIDRHEDSYVFFWTDLHSKKSILAISDMNLAELQYELSAADLRNLNSQTIRLAPYFKDLKLVYKDLDFGFLSPDDFTPVSSEKFKIQKLDGSEKSDLETFFSDCSENDQDTLDVTFENETVLALYNGNRIAAVSRLAPIRDSKVADITVVVRAGERGHGFSTPLVSEILKIALKDGYEPKYRVDETNLASIAIANRLGLKQLSHILAWEVGQAF